MGLYVPYAQKRDSGGLFRPSPIIDSSLVFHAPLWHPDLSVSPFTTKDATKHSCTVTGATWGATGRTFDGGDDIIDCGTAPSLDITAAITISGWLYPETTGGGTFGRFVCTTAEEWRIFMYASPALRFDLIGAILGGKFVESNANSVPLNAWTHVAGTYNGTIQLIYINGVVQTSTNTWTDTIVPVSAGNLYIGNEPGGTRGFDGLIGQVEVFNRALTAGEILHNYLATKWRYGL